MKRVRKQSVRKNPLNYGQSEDVHLTRAVQFRIESYISVIDQLITSLVQKVNAYSKVDSYLRFLRKIQSLSYEEIKESSLKLIKLYDVIYAKKIKLTFFKYTYCIENLSRYNDYELYGRKIFYKIKTH